MEVFLEERVAKAHVVVAAMAEATEVVLLAAVPTVVVGKRSS